MRKQSGSGVKKNKLPRILIAVDSRHPKNYNWLQTKSLNN